MPNTHAHRFRLLIESEIESSHTYHSELFSFIFLGEKPFACDKCFDCFAQSWQLRKHKAVKCAKDWKSPATGYNY